LRATGYGWTTNLFGRGAEVVTPILISQLIPLLGISWGVSMMAVGPILGALLVWKFAPETKGLSLEEIQEQLAAAAEARKRNLDKGVFES